MQCPICGNESLNSDSVINKCCNNHVYTQCPEHKTLIVLSLIGEIPYIGIDSNKCVCDHNCLSPRMNECYENDEDNSNNNLHLITPETHYSPQYLDKVLTENDDLYTALDNAGVVIDASAMVLVAESKNYPSATNPPLHMPESSKEAWVEFCAKYSDKWNVSGKPLEQRWGIAIAIWNNYCAKHNIIAFDTASDNPSAMEYMAKRIHTATKDAYKVINTFERMAVNQKFIEKVQLLRLTKVAEVSPGKWEAVMGAKLQKCLPFTDQRFRMFLQARKFIPQHDKFTRTVSPIATLVVEEIGNAIYMNCYFKYTTQLLKVGLDLNDNVDSSVIVKKLSALIKNDMRDLRRGDK